jgi:hypothetical protein
MAKRSESLFDPFTGFGACKEERCIDCRCDECNLCIRNGAFTATIDLVCHNNQRHARVDLKRFLCVSLQRRRRIAAGQITHQRSATRPPIIRLHNGGERFASRSIPDEHGQCGWRGICYLHHPATDAHADGAQVGVAEAAFGKAANETGLADGKVSYQANFRAIVHR